MAYNLIITERAEELLENIIDYLFNSLHNRSAAIHLLDSIEKIYGRIENNPYEFPYSQDDYLQFKQYRVAVVPDMNYLVIFRIEEMNVYILGVFHNLENYKSQL